MKAPGPALDTQSVGAAVELVLKDEIYWFPVRHHSPRVARHLDSTIRSLRPKVVFIEGPSEATALVPHVIDARTRPPVAIYSAYRAPSPDPAAPRTKDAQQAVWYPLLSYSPEYVAMRAAAAVRATIEFIDLPHWARPHGPSTESAEEEPIEEIAPTLDVEGAFYASAAAAAGFSSWDQAWDSLFEFGTSLDDRDVFRRELLTFCAAARSSASPERMLEDGTVARERFMWKSIRDGIQRLGVKPSDAMVVCGGFHVFLDRDDLVAAPDVPFGEVQTALVPYSFFRVSRLSGYQAGNRAPRFYERVWELHGRDHDEIVAQHVVEVLKRARALGEPASSADAISVAQHARMLGALRRHEVATLDDVQDAVITCCCKGDPGHQGVHLTAAMDHVAIGTKVGTVSPDAGRLPIVSDFHEQLQALDLAEVVDRESRITRKVDRRDPVGRRQAAFLRRLVFLEIPFAEIATHADGAIFTETWRLKWNPEIETQLADRAHYGESLESAARARLREDLGQIASHAGTTARRLREATEMDLPDLAGDVRRACRVAVDADPRFLSLAEALGELQILRRHFEHSFGSDADLVSLVGRCYDRACFALPEAANAPEEDHERIVEGLRIVAETLVDASAGLDRDLFVQYAGRASSESQTPFLQGALMGMLAELRVVPAEGLSVALAAFALQPPDVLARAGEFLDGMLASCRTSLLLGSDHLTSAIDDLLRAAEDDAFLTMLPRLRSAFRRLHERQRRTLADTVARRLGLTSGAEVTRLGASSGAAALFARIDARAARILEEWRL